MFDRTPKLIKHLIIINIIMFLATQAMPGRMENLFAMHFPLNPRFRIWQVITHIFMHGGPMHIAFNMYALWVFGSPLYRIWGEKRFLIFYFVAGLAAVALQTGVYYYVFTQGYDQLVAQGISHQEIFQVLNEGKYFTDYPDMAHSYITKMVGASGAIYGLMVALAFYFPNSELIIIPIPIPIKVKYYVTTLILGDIFLGITESINLPIAHFAHVGGALAGFIMMKLWGKFKHERWY